MNKIILKNIKFKNFISNNKEIFLDFEEKFQAHEKSDFYLKTLHKKRKESKNDTGIMKVLGIIGKNSSYKTSTIKAIDHIFRILELCDSEAIKFYKFESIFGDESDFNSFIQEAKEWSKSNNVELAKESLGESVYKYQKHVIDIMDQNEVKICEEKFIIDKYNFLATNKNEPLEFEVEYFLKENFNIIQKLSLTIFKINDRINYILKHNNKECRISELSINHFSSSNLKIKMIDSELGDIDLIIKKLYSKIFKTNKKMEKFLNKLDPSIISFTKTTSEKYNEIKYFELTRVYSGLIETTKTAKNLSTGTKLFLKYALSILENDVLIFDEIENALHFQYIKLLIEIVKSKDKQIIFTTHSPLVVQNLLSQKQLYIFDLKEDGELKISKASNLLKPTSGLISNYLKGLISSPNNLDIDELFMDLNEK